MYDSHQTTICTPAARQRLTHAPGMQSIRFWDYIDGNLVRLTLSLNASVITHTRGGYTDEGWERVSVTYEWDVDAHMVILHTFRAGADCDGRYDHEAVYTCMVEDLRRDYDEYADVMMPAWTRVDTSQRDYSAEAMGY